MGLERARVQANADAVADLDRVGADRVAPAGGEREEEVRVAQQILQSLGIRSFTPQVTACPGCGRTTSTFFQEMADQIQNYLRDQMPVLASMTWLLPCSSDLLVFSLPSTCSAAAASR